MLSTSLALLRRAALARMPAVSNARTSVLLSSRCVARFPASTSATGGSSRLFLSTAHTHSCDDTNSTSSSGSNAGPAAFATSHTAAANATALAIAHMSAGDLSRLPLPASPSMVQLQQARLYSSSTRTSSTSTSKQHLSASPAASAGQAPQKQEAEEDEEERDRKAMQGLTSMQKFRYMLRRYGKFAAVYYFLLGTADLSLYYTAISMGVDVQPFLDSIFSYFGGSPDWVSPKYGNLIAAYSVHKVMTVPRVLVVVSTTPSIIKRIKIRYPNFYNKFLR
ncbi:hypothetical protein PTSG_07637 [Salpingoeca rosetta]|uniref:DUF1279 domain-containing protein n=1 Tax=Salpingoeca rosetta (strain ATCC 50818 / BSB-021) TaxID=946362 RepID=F2UHC1_SALR5|nr:uncharacterized protein PTSG_07637 [Salpingoeca rosetta]EGD76520.1 hypothetical protein PTSG_07637 [Salpingoeca rosetta]|eukprot:XP_004991434.1 hypothetical protein PTSG_07637 [Salpingoeca rosetta]